MQTAARPLSHGARQQHQNSRRNHRGQGQPGKRGVKEVKAAGIAVPAAVSVLLSDITSCVHGREHGEGS